MDDEKYGTLQVDTPWYIYFCLFPLGGSPTNIMPLVSFLHLKCVLLIYRSRISVSGGNRNVIYSHLFGSTNGFSVSDPTDEAAGRGWRGGDRKAALAEANVQELHSHLGRYFYDNHHHHRPGK